MGSKMPARPAAASHCCGTTPRRRPDEHSEGGLQDSLAAGAAGEVSLRVLQWSHMELARARK